MQTFTPEQFKSKYGNVGLQQPTVGVTAQQGFGERIKSMVGREKGKIANIRGSQASGLTKGLQQAAVVTGLPLKAGYQALPEIARTGLEKVGEFVGKGIGKVSDKIADIPAVQKFATGLSEEQFRKTSDVLSGISAAGETAGNVAVMYGAAKAGVAGAEKLGQGIKAVSGKFKSAAQSLSESSMAKYPKEIAHKWKTGGVDEQTQTILKEMDTKT